MGRHESSQHRPPRILHAAVTCGDVMSERTEWRVRLCPLGGVHQRLSSRPACFLGCKDGESLVGFPHLGGDVGEVEKIADPREGKGHPLLFVDEAIARSEGFRYRILDLK